MNLKYITGPLHPHAALMLVLSILLAIAAMFAAFNTGEIWLLKTCFALGAIEAGLILTVPSEEKRLAYLKGYRNALRVRREAATGPQTAGQDTAAIDAEMDARAREIAVQYLMGQLAKGTLLERHCEHALDPEGMKQTFKKHHGFDWDSAQAAPLQLLWAHEWYEHNLILDKSALLSASALANKPRKDTR